MAPLEILEHFGQLGDDRLRIEPKYALDDAVRPRPVGRVAVAGFDRELEWPHDNSRRIGTQVKGLPIQERGL